MIEGMLERKSFKRPWRPQTGRDSMDHDCNTCAHNGDDEYCDECSNLWNACCSCHIAPPCSFCVNNLYEEIQK